MRKLLLFVFSFITLYLGISYFIPARPRFDYSSTRGVYESSQYCLTGYRSQFKLDQLLPEYAKLCGSGLTFGGNINDPELYELAGSSYIQAASPTSINWELQPLGKYLFGLSISLTGSSNSAIVLSITLVLVLTYLLARMMGIGKLGSLIAAFLVFLDPLFRATASLPYLDLWQTVFILGFIITLLRSLTQTKGFLAPFLTLSLVMLSKSFAIGPVLWLIGLITIFACAKPRITQYLVVSLSIPLFYTLGYLPFFTTHNLYDFLILHVDILRYYHSYLPNYPRGEIWRIILTGKWRTWWDGSPIIKVAEFRLWWPLGIIASIVTPRTRALSFGAIINLLWIFAYLIFASLRLVFPRYLIPIIPSLYLSIVYLVSHIAQIYQFATIKKDDHQPRSIRADK